MKEFVKKLGLVFVSVIILSYFFIPQYEFYQSDVKIYRFDKFSGKTESKRKDILDSWSKE